MCAFSHCKGTKNFRHDEKKKTKSDEKFYFSTIFAYLCTFFENIDPLNDKKYANYHY